MRRVRKLTTAVLATLGVLAGSLMLTAAPALAGTGHGYSSSFGAGQLKEPSGVAVNDATGDVYVVDKGNKRVEQLTASGTFIREFAAPPGGFSTPEAIAVDNSGSGADPSKEDVYVTDGGAKAIDKFSVSGAYLGQITKGAGGAAFEKLDGIGVDPNGTLWVYLGGNGGRTIDGYSDALVNVFTSERGSQAPGEPQPGFAVNSEDDFYVVSHQSKTVTKLNTSGGSPEELGGIEGVTGVAVDLSTNDVFVDTGTAVHEFAAAGAPIQTFGSKQLADGGGTGVAVNSANGTVYVADSAGDEVLIFAEGPTPEAPSTGAASGETPTSAVLHGELNPNAKAEAGWYFAYNLGAECTGGQTTSVEAEADVQASHVEKTVAGLSEPNAQYTFCLVATSEYGETFGLPKTFTTAAVPPNVDGESTSAVKSTEATLEAQVNPNNEKTTYSFEYATDAALTGAKTAVGTSELEGFGDQLASVTLSGLKAGETYYYRVVAANGTLPVQDGTVQSFTTVPVPTVEAPTSVGTATATFHGKLAPLNPVATEYFFAYNIGEEPVCTGEHETAHESAGTGSGTFTVPATPAGELQPNQKYTVCLVSVNASGSEDSAPVYFTTGAVAPTIISETASSTFAEEGKLEAVINPENQKTSYFFEYSTSEAEVLAGNGTKAEGAPPQAELEGFSPEGTPVSVSILFSQTETVYYRVVAENEQSKTEGKPIEGKVQAYTKLPAVENGSSSNLTSLSAKLEATVYPNYNETKYFFEYAAGEHGEELLENHEGTLVSHSSGTLPGRQPEPKEEESLPPTPVSAEFTGLQPGETYYYRAVAENKVSKFQANANEGKPIDGPIESFKTYAGPTATTGEAQNVTGTAATLSGTVDPDGVETNYSFQYISEGAYQAAIAKGSANPYAEGEATTPVNAGSGEADQAAGPVPASGLRPGETYHYRLLATNKYGVQAVGGEGTFTTQGATPPVVTTGGVSNVSQNSATLSGTVATSGLQTEYGFEIGTTPGTYGPVTGLGSIGGAATEAVSLTLGELQPGTTYYYRVTATSVDGTVSGEPVSFTTPGFPTLLAPPASPPLIPYTSPAFPKEEKPSGTTVKTLTNKEKLAAALKVCKREKSKSKRQKCEKAARKRVRHEGSKKHKVEK